MSNAIKSRALDIMIIGTFFPLGVLESLVTDKMGLSAFLTGGFYPAVPASLFIYFRTGSLEPAITRYGLPIYAVYTAGELMGELCKKYVLNIS